MKQACKGTLLAFVLATQVWAQPSPTPTAQALEANARHGEFNINVHADHDRFELGETQRIVYKVQGPADGQIEFPEAAKLDLKPFEVTDASAIALPAQGNRRTWEFRVKVVAYETGNLSLPPAGLTVRNKLNSPAEEIDTPGLEFHVERVPAGPEDKPDQVRDLKPLEMHGIPPLLVVAGLAGLIALALLSYAFIRWLRRPRKAKVEPPLAPYPRALRDLQALRASDLQNEQGWGEFYERLSHILRAYLSWRCELPLLEQTTSETLRSLNWNGEPHQQMREILETADLIKFAKSPPTQEQAGRHLDLAEKLVMVNAPAAAQTEVRA